MNLALWFPQPIWFKDYDVDFSEAINYIQKLKVSSAGRKISNVGGWQSDFVDFKATKELETAFNIIMDGTNHVVGQVQGYGFKGLKLDTAWINVNKGADFNKAHVHPEATFSGCLYLKTSDKSGNIEFMRPDNMDLYPGFNNKTGMFCQALSYKPTVGKLLIFPPWLSHMVLPSGDEEERISIGFNLIHEGQ